MEKIFGELIELAKQGGPFVAVFMTVMFFLLLRRYDKLQERTERNEEAAIEAQRETRDAIKEFNSIFKPSPRRPR